MVILFITGIVLIYGKDLLIPFVLAVFIWFIIREIRLFLRRNRFIRSKIPGWLQNMVSGIIFFLIISFFARIIKSNIADLSENLSAYEGNVHKVTDSINAYFHIDLTTQLNEFAGGLNFASILTPLINSISGLIGNVLIILIYVLFLLMEEYGFINKLNILFPDPDRNASIKRIIQRMDHSIGRYLGLKTLVSVLTGGLSYIVLLVIGVDAAAFWAFLIFAMNYIPTVGSLTATLFPAFFALLQFGTFGPALWVLVIIGAIQFVVGNVIEPRVMGDSLNLSSLVVVLALSFWGALWGISGMFLSVPITVILLILFSEFEATRSIAILLSEKGKLENEDQ